MVYNVQTQALNYSSKTTFIPSLEVKIRVNQCGLKHISSLSTVDSITNLCRSKTSYLSPNVSVKILVGDVVFYVKLFCFVKPSMGLRINIMRTHVMRNKSTLFFMASKRSLEWHLLDLWINPLCKKSAQR